MLSFFHIVKRDVTASVLICHSAGFIGDDASCAINLGPVFSAVPADVPAAEVPGAIVVVSFPVLHVVQGAAKSPDGRTDKIAVPMTSFSTLLIMFLRS
jgi:hypothetical protein